MLTEVLRKGARELLQQAVGLATKADLHSVHSDIAEVPPFPQPLLLAQNESETAELKKQKTIVYTKSLADPGAADRRQGEHKKEQAFQPALCVFV